VPKLETCEDDLFSSSVSSSPSDVSGNDGSFLCLVYGTQKSHQSLTTNTGYYCSSSIEPGTPGPKNEDREVEIIEGFIICTLPITIRISLHL
jgi:hypothetical protein